MLRPTRKLSYGETRRQPEVHSWLSTMCIPHVLTEVPNLGQTEVRKEERYASGVFRAVEKKLKTRTK